MRRDKIQIARKRLSVLGFVVTPQGVEIDPERTRAVAQFPQPKDKKALISFLGLASYLRAHVKGYAKLSEPLSRLTGDKAVFTWTSEQDQAFVALKAAITSAPVLAHFDASLATELHTDASQVGLSAKSPPCSGAQMASALLLRTPVANFRGRSKISTLSARGSFHSTYRPPRFTMALEHQTVRRPPCAMAATATRI
jgi:hypothetical protein